MAAAKRWQHFVPEGVALHGHCHGPALAPATRLGARSRQNSLLVLRAMRMALHTRRALSIT